MPYYHITNISDFKKVIGSGAPTIVKFGANWCGPCKRIADDYHRLGEQYKNIVFLTINIDEDDELSELSLEYDVKGLPTFILLINGREQNYFRFSGADMRELMKKIDKLTH